MAETIKPGEKFPLSSRDTSEQGRGGFLGSGKAAEGQEGGEDKEKIEVGSART